MNTPAYQRAMILHRQRRYADAEGELRQALAGDPRDARAHAMLALCLTEQKRFREATAEAQQAIGLEPALDFAHYALAKILLDRNRPGDALPSISEAVRLDPYNADYFWLLGAIRFEQRGWPSALEAAERGLALDAEHEGCTNLRAMALVKLGRRSEAGTTIGAALSRNPENAVTHANQGWTLLHEGNPKAAMVHFREALRLDPSLDWTRAGIVEAIKARNPIYRWLLLYFLWMARLSTGAQWTITICAYVGYRLMLNIAEQVPPAAPWLWPIVWAYIAFVAMTWLAYPLFNLALRLHPTGRHALSADQRRGANVTAAVLVVALVAIGCFMYRRTDPAFLLTLVFALLLIPSSAIFRCESGWPRWTMLAITLVLLATGMTAVGIEFAFSDREDALLNRTVYLLRVYAYGILASSIAANWLASTNPKK